MIYINHSINLITLSLYINYLYFSSVFLRLQYKVDLGTQFLKLIGIVENYIFMAKSDESIILYSMFKYYKYAI